MKDAEIEPLDLQWLKIIVESSTAITRRILEEAELPTDPNLMYRKLSDGPYETISLQSNQPKPPAKHCLTLVEYAERKFGRQSAQWDAAFFAEIALTLEYQIAAKRYIAAACSAYQLGQISNKLGITDAQRSKLSEQARQRGRRKKRREWAEILANELRARQPTATKYTLWLLIPETWQDIQGLTIEANNTLFGIYRDGERVICVDIDVDREIDCLAQSSFFRRYLKGPTIPKRH